MGMLICLPGTSRPLIFLQKEVVSSFCNFGTHLSKTKISEMHRWPPPPTYKTKIWTKSGQNMAPNASKQGKLDSFAAIYLFIFLPCMWGLGLQNDSPKITSTSTERQKRSQNSAPVLVIISGNSLLFFWKIITGTGFYRCCAAGASAPVLVKKSVSQFDSLQSKCFIPL